MEIAILTGLRGINNCVEALNSLITEWPRLRHNCWALLDDSMLLHESEKARRPGIELCGIIS